MKVLKIKLGILDVTSYLEANANSRCIYEGEAVLDEGYIILCGKMQCLEEDIIQLYGLCLQTSDLDADPHEIEGVLDVDQEKATVQNMTCSCKVGNSGKCKHISALLFKCSRMGNLNELEEISQAYIKCLWSTQKGMTAVPIGEMSCFQGKVHNYEEKEDNIEMLNFLTTNVPNNSVKKHMEGLRKVGLREITARNINIDEEDISENIWN